MAYGNLPSNFSSMNDAQKNDAAIAAGYTGLSNLNDNLGSATYGSGGSSSGANPSVTPGSYTEKYVAALQQLRSQPSSITSLSKTMTDATQSIVDQSNSMADQTVAQIPLIATIYDKLAASLELSKTAEVKSTTTLGLGEVGRQKAALASEGVSAGTGAVAAPVALAEETLKANIASVIDKYQLKSEQYTAEEAKTVSDLNIQANDYKLKGMTAVADLSTKLASLKLDEEKMIQSMASDIAKGESDAEKLAMQQVYNQQLLELKQQQVEAAGELAASKLAISQANLDLSQQRLQNTLDKSSDTPAIQQGIAGGMLLAYTTKGSTQGQSLRKQYNKEAFKQYLQSKFPDATKYIEDYYTNNNVQSNY